MDRALLVRGVTVIIVLAVSLAGAGSTVADEEQTVAIAHARAAAARISPLWQYENDSGVQYCTRVRGFAASGSVITADGYILTNEHVANVENLDNEAYNTCSDPANPESTVPADLLTNRYAVAFVDDTGRPVWQYQAELVDSDAGLDLAVLRIVSDAEGNSLDPAGLQLPFLEFGNSDALAQGDDIFILGYPANADAELILSTGVVSGFAFDEAGQRRMILSEAMISGGNSGGMAIDARGQLVGVPRAASWLDCRQGDTNNDGRVDDEDAGCKPVGGSWSHLIPSNLALPFVQGTLGEAFGRVPSGEDMPPTPGPGQGPPDVTPDSLPPGQGEVTPTPSSQDVPGFLLVPLGEDGTVVQPGDLVSMLQACFAAADLQLGPGGTWDATWYQDGMVTAELAGTWDGTSALQCLTLLPAPGTPVIAPGSYAVVVRANGLELRSAEIAIPAPKPGQAADPGAGGNQYIGPITLTAVGEGGAPVMGGSPPARINGCAENRGLQPGESYTASWTFNGAYWTGNTYTFDGQAAEVCTWIAPGPGQQAFPEGEVTLTIVINGIAETSGILRIGTDTVSQPATTPAPAGSSGG